MKKRYYLAYGSNLNVPQMRRRCPGAQIVGAGEITDYRLLFKGSRTGAYLTIEPVTGGKVPVGVWSVTAADEAALDRYEGFPHFYYKAEMHIRAKPLEGMTGKARTVSAFVYIMHEERELGLPSQSYLDTCAEGYRTFGFDPELLQEAVRVSGERREQK